jgi:hypothetical protein
MHMYMYMDIQYTYIVWKTEKASFRLFSANGNGKWKFVFLGRSMINGNRRSLFQQMCPSMTSCQLGWQMTWVFAPWNFRQSYRLLCRLCSLWTYSVSNTSMLFYIGSFLFIIPMCEGTANCFRFGSILLLLTMLTNFPLSIFYEDFLLIIVARTRDHEKMF